MNRSFFVFFLIISSFGFSQNIVINEIMAANSSTLKDNAGNYSDWIELRNKSAVNYDLASHYISDKINNKTKFQFTSTPGKVVIPAHGYLIIWASGNIEDGYNHTSFSLSASGEAVVLTMPDGITKIDEVEFDEQTDDISYGLNTAGNLMFFSPSSPGVANNDANSYEGFLPPPVFSKGGGFFQSNFSLSIGHPESGSMIFYSTDGSDPSPFNTSGTSYNYKDIYPKNPGDFYGDLTSRSYISYAYSGPISISDRTSSSNQISMINTTTANSTPDFIPAYNVPKSTIIRAIAVKPGYLPSKVVTNSYIYSSTGNNPYSFPVASVITQEDNLFDYENGIYTPGKTFDDDRAANPTKDYGICPPGNFTLKGKETQKTGNFELFDNTGPKLNTEVGIRINGSCTTSFPYKSLRLYGNNQFDNYSFFDSQPTLKSTRLLLRNSGNDQFMTLFKDEFNQEWMKHLNFGSQMYKPSILYLNGEYWGIHNIRERIDKYFLEANYGIDPDNIDLRKVNFPEFGPDEMDEGDDIHYNNMYNFIMGNSMTNTANYDSVKKLMVLESLIDLYVAEIYIGNIDWPQNNIRLWRTRNAYNPNGGYSDGRWRFIFYDTDRGLGDVVDAEHSNLNDVLTHVTFRRSEVFVKLLTNNTFKNAFLNRFADLLNTSFRKEFAAPIFNTLKSKYDGEVSNHINRWKSHPNKSAWESETIMVASYINDRRSYMIGHLNTSFGISGTYDLTVKSQNMSYGYIIVNSIAIDPGNTRGLSMDPSSSRTWTGQYFKNTSVKISAKARAGYKFSYWMYNGNKIYDQEISVNSTANRTYEAFFEYTGLSETPFPEAYSLSSCSYKFKNWSSGSAGGTYPPNSAFVQWSTVQDPTIANINQKYELVSGAYNLTTRTRINGLGSNGVSFLNDDSGNTGYSAAGLGGMVVAINTTDMNKVYINWKAKTIKSGSRKYNIRLLYRVGDMAYFAQIGPTYTSGANDHSTNFEKVELPAAALNKGYVQLIWQYYYTGTGSSGNRDELSISDIEIYEVIKRPENSTPLGLANRPGAVISTETLNPLGQRKDHATKFIELLPGFEAKSGSVFSAEIKNCIE